jgi:hypothetical protein
MDNKHRTIDERITSANIIFAKAGVLCFYESLVQGSSSVFQINICAKNPRLRKYENRYPHSFRIILKLKR